MLKFAHEDIGISWGKFGSHSGSLELFVEFVIELKRVVF